MQEKLHRSKPSADETLISGCKTKKKKEIYCVRKSIQSWCKLMHIEQLTVVNRFVYSDLLPETDKNQTVVFLQNHRRIQLTKMPWEFCWTTKCTRKALRKCTNNSAMWTWEVNGLLSVPEDYLVCSMKNPGAMKYLRAGQVAKGDSTLQTWQLFCHHSISGSLQNQYLS